MKKTRLIFLAMAVMAIGLGLFTFNRLSRESTVGISEKSTKSALIPAVQPKLAQRAARSMTADEFLAALPTNQTASVRNTKPFVLTSEEGFQKSLRLAAESMGARTVGVLTRHALLVEASPSVRARLAADGRFKTTDEFLPMKKVARGLAAEIAAGAEKVQVAFLTLSPEDRLAVQRRVKEGGGEILKGCLNDRDTFRATVPAGFVADLAACGDVRWMEKFERPRFMNDLAVEPAAMNVRAIWKSEDLPNGLSGAGQTVTTSDSGIDTGDLGTMHRDLRNRLKGIKVVDGCHTNDVIGHGTHTAGSIVGDGTESGGQIRGSAWGANLYAWFCGGEDDGVYTPDNPEELFQPDQDNWPAFIHSASWGTPGAGEYTSECESYDRFVWENPVFLPVFSAGNEGSQTQTIGAPGSAKNLLTVGATQNVREGTFGGGNYPRVPSGDPKKMASYSSRGPCADGRIKPDLATPGSGILSTRSTVALDERYGYGIYNEFYAYDCGTSMACPLAAGAVALVREWLMRPDGGGFTDAEPPTAALMKAIVTGGAKDALKPDMDKGWGRMDVGQTLFPDGSRAIKLIDRIPFEEGKDFHYVIETTNAAPLDVQLVWIDYPGDPAGRPMDPKLINDLDLTVEAMDGTRFTYGNGGEEPDSLNNVESVRFASVPTDRYLVTVSCSSVLYDHEQGGAAALYIRGAFDPEASTDADGHYRVRVSGAGPDRLYMSLDRALREVQDGEKVEILSPVMLHSSFELLTNCTITATNPVAAASTVTFGKGASLKIGNGARVLFDNVAFAMEDGSDVKVSVATNGCAAITGFVGINTLEIAGADSFELAGAITAPIFIDCTNRTAGAVFGRVTGVGAEACASMIRNSHDEDLGGKVSEADLVWVEAAVPHDAAVVRLLQDGTEANYLSLGKLLRFVTNDAEIVICRNCPFTNAVTVSRKISIASESSASVVRTAAAARFALASGGSLTLRNVTFDGNEDGRSAPFVTVGSGAALTLANGARIRGFKYTGSSDGGTILLDGGELTMRSGAEIRKCSARGSKQYGQLGGGINAKSGTLNLLGGTIAECSATKYGGGVYTEVPAHVGGALKISGNTPNNLYVYGKDNLIQVDSGMGGAQVMTRNSSTFSPSPNDADEVFARVTAALSASALDGLNGAFVNDVDSSLKSAVKIDGSVTNLIWSAGAVNPRICPEEDAANARARVIWPNQTTNLWYHAADALTDATDGCIVELLKDDSLAGELALAGGAVELRTAADASSAVCRLSREQNCRVTVSSGSGLVVTGVVFQGVATSGDKASTVPFFNLRGGSMTLGADAEIRDVRGDGSRAADAVVVWEGGHFVLDGGSIHDCSNAYVAGVESGCGAAILLEGEDSVVELKSGRIYGCSSARGGAVFASDKSAVRISGTVDISGNTLSEDSETPSNLVVSDLSSLVLVDELADGSKIDYTEGVEGNTNVFGTVDADYYARAAADEAGLLALSRSAASFSHDLTGARGVVATNDVRQLLVWSTAVVDGRFVDEDGSVYGAVIVVPPPTEIDPPTAVSALVYTGAEQTGVVASVGFTLTGNVGTNAGPYTAVAKLEEGYVWTGGGVGDMQVDWSIAKATYDMSGVVFTNVTYVCDGSAKSNLVDAATLPAGVSVTNYLNNGQTEVGAYTVTAQFGGDEVNYEPIADMTATLTIIDSPTPPPGPTPDPVYTNSPSPIAFESITRQSETSWILVVTNREPYCWYRLIYTDDLTKGFTSTGDWVQATVDAPKAWTNKVDFNSGEVSPAYFWRAEGTWGTDEVPPVSPDDRPPAP